MNSSMFTGKKFYIIFSNDIDIKNLLNEAGAIYQSYLSESLSFAISDNSSASEVSEADELYDVTVVTSEWIRLCFQWGQCQYMKAFHPSIRNLFQNLKIFISNVNSDDAEKLRGYIQVYGGQISMSADEEKTHVVIGVIEGDSFDKLASQCNDKTVLVTPDWVVESINSRSIKPTAAYQPQALFERLKQLQISNELERVSQARKAAASILLEPPKKPVTEANSASIAPQIGIGGLPQATVPISIQDSLLTRQLPTGLGRPDPPPPIVPTQQPQFSGRPNLVTSTANTQRSVVPPQASTVVTTVGTTAVGGKTKTGKSSSANKHLQEQGLNESEKEAIVMQNVMSILGQSHPRRSPAVSMATDKTAGSSAPTVTGANKKPRSPRLKGGGATSSVGACSKVPVNQPIATVSAPGPPNVSSKPGGSLPSGTGADHPHSPSVIIETNPMRPLQQQASNVPRFGLVCATGGGPLTGSSVAPFGQAQSGSNGSSQLLVQQQQQSMPVTQSSLYPRPQRAHLQQQQQHKQQQQQQLIALGQIQTAPGHHQIQQQQQHQHWPIGPTPQQQQQQHATAPATILSPGALCATVTGPGTTVQQQAGMGGAATHQMYQLTNQQANYYRWMNQLTRNGIINSANPMMLNNLGNGMPINAAQCASMVTNVTGPLHLQSPVGNGNPATLMLHQQQLHVTGNLTSSSAAAMHSPNNVTGNPNLNLASGKILAGSCARSILQHSPQMAQGVRMANPPYSVLQQTNQGMAPTNMPPDHVHHANNAHLSRPFPGLLRLPQYVGHEGLTMGICRENCLIGCVFYLYGYNDVSQAKRDNWLSAIRSHGGETATACNFPNVTHLIVDCQLDDPDLFKLGLRSKTRVVTIYWVNDVIEKGHLEPPFEIIHLPSPFSKNLSFSYIRKQIVSITGFEGEERKKVEYMVIQLGVKYTEYLEASNTVLICKKPQGRKYDAAQKLNIACVNVRWLQDLYFGDLQTLSSDIDHKYQCFEPSYVSIRLERHTHRVQELMVGWLVPIRLDDNSWKRFRVLQEQCEAEKMSKKRQAEVTAMQSPINAKKPKWDLPTLTDEDRLLADNSTPKYSKMAPVRPKLENGCGTEIKSEPMGISSDNVDEFLQHFEPQPPIIVAFTGLVPEQRDKLADLVLSMGGQVTDNMTQFTHLVTKTIIRTPKFYFGVLRGCQIVTMKWILASAYRQQFIDEKHFQLDDKEGERQYGFSLKDSLARAQKRRATNGPLLFDSLEFFLSPRAKHRQVCIDLIRACGGTIREKRPIQKMALMPEPKHLIICHEDDSHLANYLTRTKTGNKAVHHEEFVLSGVMRQELDYDSYQIQYVSVMKNAFNNQSMTGCNPMEMSSGNITTNQTANIGGVGPQHDTGRDSPSRSAMSDSTADTIDTQTSQSESINVVTTQAVGADQHLVDHPIKSEPVVMGNKYLDANIFSKIGYPSPHVASTIVAMGNVATATQSHHHVQPLLCQMVTTTMSSAPTNIIGEPTVAPGAATVPICEPATLLPTTHETIDQQQHHQPEAMDQTDANGSSNSNDSSNHHQPPYIETASHQPTPPPQEQSCPMATAATAVEATVISCRDQDDVLVSSCSPAVEESFSVQQIDDDGASLLNNAISCAMVPINMATTNTADIPMAQSDQSFQHLPPAQLPTVLEQITESIISNHSPLTEI